MVCVCKQGGDGGVGAVSGDGRDLVEREVELGERGERTDRGRERGEAVRRERELRERGEVRQVGERRERVLARGEELERLHRAEARRKRRKLVVVEAPACACVCVCVKGEGGQEKRAKTRGMEQTGT